MAKIPGGFVLQARKTDNSEIAHKPPHFREIFNWLYRQANHHDNGKFKRGQCMRSIRDIQEGLSWFVGYRKVTYTKAECENSLRWLRNNTMINTMKTTRGMVITICNYDFYQNPKNYESNKKATMKATRKQQTPDTINKNDKNKLIGLASLLLETQKSKSSVYSILNKYKASLGQDELTRILESLYNRGKKFDNENQLARYLQGCTKQNGRITDHLHDLNDPKYRDSPGYM
jgi:hypothetical protein